MRVYTRLTLLLICLLWQSLTLAEITLSVTDKQINPAESTQLIITLTGKDSQSTPPNIGAIKSDFEILHRSQSQSISIINGHTERETKWIFTLQPKRAGTLKIPAIKIGSTRTEPQTITVSKSSATEQQAQQDKAPTVFLKISLNSKEAYIQSQIRYKIQLYYAENIMNGTLTDPSVANANIIRLPQDKNFQKKVKGKLYQVLERDYAIFPEKSGTLLISGPSFSGLRSQQPAGIDQFDPFFNTNKVPVRLFGDNKTVSVKPIPSSIQPTDWLPATRVEISDQWQLPKTLEVGQPIQRLVTLKVYGSTQAQLPNIDTKQNDHFKVYADDASTQNLSEDDAIIAEKTQKFTYIPTKSGELSLPDTPINWWNIESDSAETTTLSGRSFTIRAIAGSKPETTAPTATNFSKPTPIMPTTATASEGHSFNTMLAIFFLALWLITVLLWWLQSRKRAIPLKSPQRAFKKLLKACDVGNPKLIEQRLLEWAKLQWHDDPPMNVMDVASRVTDLNLKTEMKFLESAIYGNNPNWTGRSLKESLVKYRIPTANKADKDDLPSLYPS